MRLVESVTIALVGKYVNLVDSYKSLHEALIHGGVANQCNVKLDYIDSETIGDLKQLHMRLKAADALLVPGGFGDRGIEGKIAAIEFARTNNMPFFGICLGLQLAVIEFARNIAGLKKATSQEFDSDAKDMVVAFMEEQKHLTRKGGTMRLGAYPCHLLEGTIAHKIYQKKKISERHRHRFEINNKYRERLNKKGLIFSGTSPDGELVEMIELANHPWFIGCQFHPEFKSKPFSPHPLFAAFIAAALAKPRCDG